MQDSLESKAYEFKGKVIAAREAEMAASVDGRLANINFTAGQVVKKGDFALRVRREVQTARS